MLSNMRSSDTPFVADWFVVSLRWLVLLGLISSLSLGGQLKSGSNVLLIILAIWNIIQTLFAGLSLRLAYHREISLGVDLLVAGLYFSITGGFANPAFWIIILPLLSAALYFNVAVTFIAAVVMVVVQIVTTVFQIHAVLLLLILGISVFFTFVIAGVFGYLSMRLTQTLRVMRKKQLESQQKIQHVESERLRAIYNLTSTLTAT
jgi:hypothetical protein